MTGFVVGAAKVVKDVLKEIERDKTRTKTAMTRAMNEIVVGAKKDLRAQVTGAGHGRKLANTWRGKRYPLGGKKSFGPAGFLYNKAAHIVNAFEKGSTVVARNKKFMAIPTDFARRKVGRQRLTPAVWAQAGFPKLRFVPTAKGGLLVLDGSRSKSKKSFRTGKEFRGGSSETLVMFYLVKQVKHRKTLSSETIASEWFNKYPAIVDKFMEKSG